MPTYQTYVDDEEVFEDLMKEIELFILSSLIAIDEELIVKEFERPKRSKDLILKALAELVNRNILSKKEL